MNSRRSRNQRILVVEETEPIRDVMQTLLTEEGYDVTATPSLDSAREQLAGERPDLVICDVRVPGAPVFPILDVLDADEQTRDIPVLLCTGVLADLEAAPERLIRPDTEVLFKPFDIEELLSATGRLARSA